MGNYEKIGWIDSPATDTPINADNLNHMDEGIYNADAKAEDASIIGYSNNEVIDDSINGKALGLKAYGKCYYGTATPSPENSQEIETWNGTVATSSRSESSLAELGIELYGMRLTAGGNYTDPEGQDWWCDKADFVSGTINRYVDLVELSSAWSWQQSSEGFYVSNFRQEFNVASIGHCNKLAISFSSLYFMDNSVLLTDDLNVKVSSISSLAEFRTWLDSQKVVILFTLINPTKEIIPEESRNALAMLDVYEESTNVNYGLYPPFAWLGYPKNTSSGLLFADLNSAKVVANPQIDDDAEKLNSLQVGDVKYKVAGSGGASTASDVGYSGNKLFYQDNVQDVLDYVAGKDEIKNYTINVATYSTGGSDASVRITSVEYGIDEVLNYASAGSDGKDYEFINVSYKGQYLGWTVTALMECYYNDRKYNADEVIDRWLYHNSKNITVERRSKTTGNPLFVLSEEGKSLASEEEKSYWNGKADKTDTELVSTSTTSPITDSANGCIRDFSAFGKCEQLTTKGYSKVDIDNLLSVCYGSSCEYTVSNGSISLVNNGTSAYNRVETRKYVTVQNGETITMTYKVKNASGPISSAQRRVQPRKRDGSTVVGNITYLTNGFTYTASEDCELMIQFYVGASGGAVGDKITYYHMMIESGNVAHDFEPYTGGIPSPNPSFPQEIKAWDGKIKTHGKNLLNCSGLVPQTINGVTFTPRYSNNGELEYINVNGTATADAFYSINSLFEATSNCVLNGCPAGGGNSTYDLRFASNFRDFGEGRMAESGVSGIVAIMIRANNTLNNTKFYPMIRLAEETDSSYVPYHATEADLGISLYGIKVSSGGNYTDSEGQMWLCDKIDMSKGVIERKFGTVTLNGSENWIRSQPRFYMVFDSLVKKSNYLGSILSNKLTVAPKHNSINEQYQISGYSDAETKYPNQNWLYIRTNTDVVSELVTWLESNNIDVVYELATPTTEPLTEAQINALRNLQTYSDSTYVEYGVLEPFASVEYWLDTKNGQVLADLDAKLNKILAR